MNTFSLIRTIYGTTHAERKFLEVASFSFVLFVCLCLLAKVHLVPVTSIRVLTGCNGRYNELWSRMVRQLDEIPINAHLFVCHCCHLHSWMFPSLTNLCRLRTLSSQGGGSNNAGPPSPTKPLQTPVTPTANLVKKFKLAEFRYGKEELLQLFVDSAELPADMPPLPPISHDHSSSPLAFMPLGEEEQVSKPGFLGGGGHLGCGWQGHCQFLWHTS